MILKLAIKSLLDHPRIRGKDCKENRRWNTSIGSPPHTRERPNQLQQRCNQDRITPAYAGKTLNQLVVIIAIRDHPRIRGKDYKIFIICTIIRGSPPHTRERRLYLVPSLNVARITPAYAGKTYLSVWYLNYSKDHPRIRGKDWVDDCTFVLYSGSPPHTRERLYHLLRNNLH